MRVLVTGATGFNGGLLARQLRREGHQVRALVRPGSRFRPLEADDIEVFPGQLQDPVDLDRAVAGCDQVYHLAAVFRTAGHPDSYYHDVNVRVVESLLAAARRHDCERVVHCSTVGVHGHIREAPATEDAPFRPADIYQRTKLEGEMRVRAAMKDGQPLVIVRPAMCYGEGDTRMLKLFRGLQRGVFRIIGSGRNRLHFVHGEDLARGFAQCGQSPAAIGQTFILAGPDAPRLEEVVGTICSALEVRAPRLRIPLAPVNAAAALCEMLCVPFGIEPPLHRRRVSFFKHHREFDCSRARDLVGYQPRITSDVGMARTAAWYFRQGMLKGPLPPALARLTSPG
jgi:dihydroflavonol-4-reductase